MAKILSVWMNTSEYSRKKTHTFNHLHYHPLTLSVRGSICIVFSLRNAFRLNIRRCFFLCCPVFLLFLINIVFWMLNIQLSHVRKNKRIAVRYYKFMDSKHFPFTLKACALLQVANLGLLVQPTLIM